MKKIIFPMALVAAFAVTGLSDSEAKAGTFSIRLGRGGVHLGYFGGHHHHGGGRMIWHDTSHYDWHPGYYERHFDHYHYMPGHYDFHQSGHYDYHPGRRFRGHHGHHHPWHH